MHFPSGSRDAGKGRVHACGSCSLPHRPEGPGQSEGSHYDRRGRQPPCASGHHLIPQPVASLRCLRSEAGDQRDTLDEGDAAMGAIRTRFSTLGRSEIEAVA
ncbi:hypothetical protein Rsph17029_0612 [Rhodobacter sphaeroides ATCC 17029]|nr:hypothetical protein Rsph17029_0612 [Cereibacter sphaeroides ATCC 17029]